MKRYKAESEDTMTKMRTQISTAEIRNAYKEAEIKSAVIIGIENA